MKINHPNQLPPKLLEIDIVQHCLKLEAITDAEPLSHVQFVISTEGLLTAHRSATIVSYTHEETTKVALAIYQMAYAYTLKQNNYHSRNASANLLDKYLIPKLLKSFTLMHDTNELQQIRCLVRQLSYSFSVKSAKTPTREPIEQSSAIIIQRAVRKQLFKKNPQKPQPLSNELKNSLSQHMIPESPKAPKSMPQITAKHIYEWALNTYPPVREFTRKLAAYVINYRSHEQFMTRLKDVMSQFNEYLHSLPPDQRNYALIVPHKKYIKSNHWVTGLALPFLTLKPLAVLYPYEASAFKARRPELKNLVYLDDALYSGAQMTELLTDTVSTNTIPDLQKIIIVPFYSKKIDWFVTSKVLCIRGELMLTPSDLADSKSQHPELASKANIEHFMVNQGFPAGSSTKSGTFFAHNAADNVSTFFDELHYLHPKNDKLIPNLRKPY